MNNKTFIIVVAIIILAAIIVNMPMKFDSTKEAKMAEFPMKIGEWQGKDLPLNERDYEILETKNLVMREYKNPKGESVYLYIIYSGDNRRALHPPEVCYTGGGATILEKTVIPITDSLKANKFTIERKDSLHLVVYWFKSTDLNTYSYLKQQLKVVSDRLFGRKTSGAMIRVSTDIKEGGEEAALARIKSFIAQIEPLLSRYVP